MSLQEIASRLVAALPRGFCRAWMRGGPGRHCVWVV